MSDTVLQYTRSLLYGAVGACLIHYIVVLMDTLQSRQGAKERFVFGLSIFGMAWMLVQYSLWFIVDAINLPHDDPSYARFLGSLNFIEMSTPLVFQLVFFSLAYLKPMPRWWMAVFVPIVLLYVAFIVTGNHLFVSIGHGLNLLTALIVPIIIIFMVRYYQRLLNDTYANTKSRDLTWILKLLFLMCCIYVAWVVASIVMPSIMGDCLYMLLSIALWGIYTYRITKQDFNIKVMLEIERSHEENNIVETDDVPDDVVLQVRLKAWQEPAFGEAVRHFCSQYQNFSNPDLSVQDVAQAVGTNRTYISRWCNENVGSFSNFIAEVRLEYVKKVLRDTDDSLTEVAENAGFSSARHMRMAFVARYGCTPSVYRSSNNDLENS